MLEDDRTTDAVANDFCAKVCGSLQDSIVGRNESPPSPEAYTVFCLSGLDGERDANAWLRGIDASWRGS